jgi:hypothetical protein
MNDPDSPFISYSRYPLAYVERAQKYLQLFDEGIPDSLFYAAFELCTGIEDRLFDGLDSLLRANGLPPDENITKYNPRELFPRQL